ncbi:MAG TPA: hypothetical protein VFL93_10045 [Longimicrobiaceae bacterium]|nr:hypothetical protein [Longimicrobiaceae bacterium]
MQNVIVALILAAAALYMGRRVYRSYAAVRRKNDGNGGCGGGCCGH